MTFQFLIKLGLDRLHLLSQDSIMTLSSWMFFSSINIKTSLFFRGMLLYKFINCENPFVQAKISEKFAVSLCIFLAEVPPALPLSNLLDIYTKQTNNHKPVTPIPAALLLSLAILKSANPNYALHLKH